MTKKYTKGNEVFNEVMSELRKGHPSYRKEQDKKDKATSKARKAEAKRQSKSKYPGNVIDSGMFD
jgi:hypothetical protein